MDVAIWISAIAGVIVASTVVFGWCRAIQVRRTARRKMNDPEVPEQEKKDLWGPLVAVGVVGAILYVAAKT